MTRGNNIGVRIEHLRTSRNLTQAALAKEIGVKRETVVQWEGNSRDLKTSATIKLANFFNVSCDYILCGVSAENLDFSTETGLSERAIATLKSMWDHPDMGGDPDIVCALNVLLEGVSVGVEFHEDGRLIDMDGMALVDIANFFAFAGIASKATFRYSNKLSNSGYSDDRVIALTNEALDNALISDLKESLSYLRDKYYRNGGDNGQH